MYYGIWGNNGVWVIYILIHEQAGLERRLQKFILELSKRPEFYLSYLKISPTSSFWASLNSFYFNFQ